VHHPTLCCLQRHHRCCKAKRCPYAAQADTDLTRCHPYGRVGLQGRTSTQRPAYGGGDGSCQSHRVSG